MNSRIDRSSVNINRLHSRAICDEIGERLRTFMRKKPFQLSQRLLALVKQLAKADR